MSKGFTAALSFAITLAIGLPFVAGVGLLLTGQVAGWLGIVWGTASFALFLRWTA